MGLQLSIFDQPLQPFTRRTASSEIPVLKMVSLQDVKNHYVTLADTCVPLHNVANHQ